MSYATSAQLADYLFSDATQVGRLPDDVDRLLARASEVVQDSTLGAMYDTDTSGNPTLAAAISAFRDATCAQVEFWLNGDEEDDIVGPLDSMSVAGQSQNYGSGISRVTPMYLAPRAARYLRLAGLLSGAVGSW